MPRLDQQEPAGRVDVAIAKALHQVILNADPALQYLYKAVRPELEAHLSKIAGPKSKIKDKSKRAAQITNEIKRRLAEPL